MKVAIVNLSDMDSRCMSALRYLGNCHECKRVDYCDLPQALEGRIRNLKDKIANLKRQLKETDQQVKINEQKLADMEQKKA